MFRKQMIDALFNVWVDHPYFQRPDATIDSVINVLADKFKAFANSILPYDVEMTKKIDIEKY